MFDSADVHTDNASIAVKYCWTITVDKLRTAAFISERFTLTYSSNFTGTFTQTIIQAHSPLISGTFTLDFGGALNIYSGTNRNYS
jgi:hypothetical protein